MAQEILLPDGSRVNRHDYMESQKAKPVEAAPDLKEVPPIVPGPVDNLASTNKPLGLRLSNEGGDGIVELPPVIADEDFGTAELADYVRPEKALSKFNKSELTALANEYGLELEGNKEEIYNRIVSHEADVADVSDEL